jgi:hypothetical protein
VAIIGLYLMGFVILVSGVGALGTAIAYAVHPSESKLALMRPLSLASIFGALCSFSGGVATVLQGLAVSIPTGREPVDVGAVLMGFRETAVPIFVAFAFLSVAWLLVALGMRRQA